MVHMDRVSGRVSLTHGETEDDTGSKRENVHFQFEIIFSHLNFSSDSIINLVVIFPPIENPIEMNLVLG